ncbi:hypothetical protein CHO01_30510 [Cellulomonas hominis]|uniref:AcrR family transcriptional regulator n=1 Tax=Cellulomonas hominis TaxID=156981 RepID=A0A511FFA7_9CELL|nr:TetR/AcrR family transcriptional regulator [Cellulomonas hominis]MBB5471266.1 AcrR family transcriptional regulator [Cellulomonas hominis]NKY08123.1 TetR/AcrR family transcriptional regulator [Cellulomonas hominis]GEL47935.1 hypothetical protein CHO01_30510 [Cellulomonas hominis]
MPTPPPDRRTALKLRHRRAIVDGARALIQERGGPAFTADELAQRADVSRRTVFNHFPSVADVVMTTASETLEAALAGFSSAAAGAPARAVSRAVMFDEIAELLRADDVVHAVGYLYGVLAPLDAHCDPRSRQFVLDAFPRAATHLARELTRRYPDADPLDVDLLVVSLVHGLGVIAHRWAAEVDPGAPDARARWDALVDRLVHSVRTGYLPGP